MPKTIFINIDEDATRAGRKLAAVPSPDVVLVFPKGSVIFSDESGLKKLRRYADEVHKHVTVVTADQKGQRLAREAGLAVGSVAMLRTGGASMDTARRSVPAHAPAPVAAPVPLPRQLPLSPPALHQPHQPHQPAAPSFITPKIFEPIPEPELEPAPQEPARESSHHLTKYFIAAAVIAGILLAVLATVILPHASLTVYVHAQPITRDLTVSVATTTVQSNVETLSLPGQMLSSDEQQATTFNASGQLNVGDKATGDVQIYNFTHKTLKLDAGTTTFTVGTNVYHLVSNVAGIPPTRLIPGTSNPDPSSLAPPVAIIADQPGDGYNLPSLTRFEIHNKVLGTIPQELYAESTDPTQGGISRFRTTVSQADLDTAGKSLQQSVVQAATQQLLSSRGLTLIASGVTVQVKSITFDHSVNDASETFSGTIMAHVTGLAFSEDDLKNLVEQRINSTLDANTYLVTQQQEDLGEQFQQLEFGRGHWLA